VAEVDHVIAPVAPHIHLAVCCHPGESD
jgi:hypothetical protein